MANAITEKQRLALEAFEGARTAGMTLSAYARQKGLAVREVHDAVRALRRRGAIPPTSRPRPQTRKPRFVAVRVNETAASRPVSTHEGAAARGLILRFEIARGRSAQIELADAEQLVTILRALEYAA